MSINDQVSSSAKATGGGIISLGYQQITDLSSAVGLTVPTGTKLVIVNPESKSIRWRDDGVDPTNSIGMKLTPGDYFIYTCTSTAIKFIDVGPAAILNITYYG